MSRISAQQPLTNSNYTYQHTQGCMLNALNKLAPELKLSHAECRIMTVLIGYWNKKQNKAYPTTRQLTKDCGMSSTTLTKGLKRLTDLGLIVIVKDSSTGRQNYYINQNKLFDTSSSNIETVAVATVETPCSSTHVKTNRIKTNREQTSSIKNLTKLNQEKITNDDDLKETTPNLTDYKGVLTQLEEWGVTGAKNLIKFQGLQKLKNLIKIVETKKPANPGAYLRSLLNLPDHNIPEPKINPVKTDLNNGLEKCLKIMQINEPKPTKEQILKNMIDQGNIEEAKTLSNLWKIKLQ